MNLDQELDVVEEFPETEAEQIDEETEIQDVEDDVDEIMGADAMEGDLEHAYDSFVTKNEADYDGWDEDEVAAAEADIELSDELHSEGYHLVDQQDLEEELIEMEIEEGDIYAFLVDEDDNEIGFVILDENGNEQEYLYVDSDEYELAEDSAPAKTHVERVNDGEDFELNISRDDIEDATANLNAIYKDGAELVSELRDAFADITDTFKKPSK